MSESDDIKRLLQSDPWCQPQFLMAMSMDELINDLVE